MLLRPALDLWSSFLHLPTGRVTNVFHHTQQRILLEKMTESRSFGNNRRTEVLTSWEHMECRMHRVRERTSVLSSS